VRRRTIPEQDTGLSQSPSAKVTLHMNDTSGIGSGSNAIQNAQLGISRGMANVSRDEQVIAQNPTALSDNANAFTGALVDAQQQALNVEASARALSIADQALGSLLDVTA
jgi:hypothetical protein